MTGEVEDMSTNTERLTASRPLSVTMWFALAAVLLTIAATITLAVVKERAAPVAPVTAITPATSFSAEDAAGRIRATWADGAATGFDTVGAAARIQATWAHPATETVISPPSARIEATWART